MGGGGGVWGSVNLKGPGPVRQRNITHEYDLTNKKNKSMINLDSYIQEINGNTLASHLCGRGSIPVMAVSGKAGSCLPLVGSLQYTTLANYMYWFPLPFQLPVVI